MKSKKSKNTMRNIQLRNGYVQFPNTWIVLNNEHPKDCEYVGVIEIKNSSTYHMPHFLFFSKQPVRFIKDQDVDHLYDCCESVYPEFKTIRSMQIDPIYENERIVNLKEIAASPVIGVFEIGVQGEDFSFPYNAMIVRTTKKKCRLFYLFGKR